jgi:hypothetical protein
VDSFLTKKRNEFEIFAQEEAAKSFAESRYKWFADSLSAKRAFVERLGNEVAAVRTADFPRSIVHGCRAHAAGTAAARLVAAEFVGAFLLNQLGDQVMNAAKKELLDFEDEFATFCRENEKILKSLNLPTEVC